MIERTYLQWFRWFLHGFVVAVELLTVKQDDVSRSSSRVAVASHAHKSGLHAGKQSTHPLACDNPTVPLLSPSSSCKRASTTQHGPEELGPRSKTSSRKQSTAHLQKDRLGTLVSKLCDLYAASPSWESFVKTFRGCSYCCTSAFYSFESNNQYVLPTAILSYATTACGVDLVYWIYYPIMWSETYPNCSSHLLP